MGKHRVAIILDSLAIGGAERQAFNLAIGLKKSEGFEVMVLALTVTGKGEEILKKHDVRFNVLNFEYSYRKLKILKLITSLKKEIKANDINVLIPFHVSLLFFVLLLLFPSFSSSSSLACTLKVFPK